MRRISWYLTRLRIMNRGELLHRVLEQGWILWLWARFTLGVVPSSVGAKSLRFVTGSEPQIPRLQFCGDLGECGQGALSGWPALGFSWVWSQRGYVWHRAPDTGEVWPRTFFVSIPYRFGNPYGDARVVWEPSRLQQLIWLARVAQETQGSRSQSATKMVRAQLSSWVRGNPPWSGVHYVSAMECGLRFIAVCHALDMLRSRFAAGDPVWESLAGILASHPPFIEKRISRFSSSGNHTIAEAAALVYAGVLFPELKRARHWLKEGLSLLCEQAERQVLLDGGGIEQSLHYHRFVLELIALAESLLRHHGIPSPPRLGAALDRGASFLSHMGDDQGRLPSIGDSDSGYALSPDLAILPCDRPAGSYVKVFEHSGYSVIHRDSPDSVYLILDHGPFGMPPAYGHAHCDALALFMSVEGAPQLLDPGTYTYTGEKRWRAYFRGVRAHNTVTVNGRDPAKQESAFQWSRTFGARLVEKETAEGRPIRFMATHDGYHRDGVTHWRYVAVLEHTLVIIVMDVLLGAGVHDLELNWHMPEDAIADVGGLFRAQHVSLSVKGGSSVLALGDVGATPRGWQSTVYGRLAPAASICTHYKGALPHQFVSIIRVNDANIDSPSIDRELKQGREWIERHHNG